MKILLSLNRLGYQELIPLFQKPSKVSLNVHYKVSNVGLPLA